jgi:hypothetical protein
MAVRSWRRRLGVALGGALLTVPLALTSAGPAGAETNPACPTGVTKIGTTGYIKVGDATFASVKQFKGCGKNWGYLYVWESWRNNHSGPWDICVGVADESVTPPVLRDWNCSYEVRRVELWSRGANTLTVCTHAYGQYVDVKGARTSTVC